MPVCLLEGSGDVVLYTSAYRLHTSPSLENLFGFVLLFSWCGVP
jgi:hypothetical protein